MNDKQQFSFAFNSGILIMMSLLKEMKGDKLQAGIIAAENIATDCVEKATGLPAEDVMLEIEPYIADLRKRIIEA